MNRSNERIVCHFSIRSRKHREHQCPVHHTFLAVIWMTFIMPKHKNQFNSSWAIGPSKSKPLDASNVGRKLLEKMGWENGLGLGKDNQGMVENPLWKHRRDPLSKTGFKSKNEMVANEILPHQNAFEDLLGELNSQTSEECVLTDMPLQIKAKEKAQTSKRRIRYKKMSQAKDISNYSVKDFKGIIGKEVTKKNLDRLSDNADNKQLEKETNDSYDKQSPNEKPTIDITTHNLKALQLFGSQETNIFTCNVKDRCVKFSKSEKTMKKKKSRHSKISVTEGPEALVNCSSEGAESTSVECTYNEYIRSEDNTCVEMQSAEISVKKKNRKKMKENSDNSNLFNANNCTLQNVEISVKKKKKKKDDVSYNYNLDDSCLQSGSSIDMKSTTSEYLCNTKSVSEIRQRESTASEVVDVNKSSTTQVDTSVRTSIKSCDLIGMETKKEGDLEKSNNKNWNNNTIIFMPKTNNYFFTCEESERIKKHLVENPQILQQVSDAFVGSNLMSIKGYGNW